jgi:hypothetical protein
MNSCLRFYRDKHVPAKTGARMTGFVVLEFDVKKC